MWSSPFFAKRSRSRRSGSFKGRVHLLLEPLESRIVPYALSGNAWPHPNLITLSFVPDGTNLGGVYSNLFATFDAQFASAATWENLILKAAQQWAQNTNVNFSLVPDSGAPSGSGTYQQGDPTMGDIRIGGFNFGSNVLASTFMPPPVNNYSLAGDMTFNTGRNFGGSGGYDLFTIAMHEFGHALGLMHSTKATAVMYPYYLGAKSGLTTDDIKGIQAIYSRGLPRSQDSYDAQSSDGSFSTAANITSLISSTSLTALVTNLDITTTSDLDYYVFTAPSGSSGSLTVSVQSKGLSLLAPKVFVYNAGQQLIGSASGAGQYGAALTLTVSGIVPGATDYVEVAGADSSAFGTGAYALTLNFGTGPSPTVPRPNTETLNGSPLSGGGGVADTTNRDGQEDMDISPLQVTATSLPAGATLTSPPTSFVVQFSEMIDPSALLSAPPAYPVYIQGADGSKYYPSLDSFAFDTNQASFLLFDALPNGDYVLHLSGPNGLVDLSGNPLDPNDGSGDYVIPFSVSGPARGTDGNPSLWTYQPSDQIPTHEQTLGVLFPRELQAGVTIARNPLKKNQFPTLGNQDVYSFQVLQGEHYLFLSPSASPGTQLILTDASGNVIPAAVQADGVSLLAFLQPGTYGLTVGGWDTNQAFKVSYQITIKLLDSLEQAPPIPTLPPTSIRLATVNPPQNAAGAPPLVLPPAATIPEAARFMNIPSSILLALNKGPLGVVLGANTTLVASTTDRVSIPTVNVALMEGMVRLVVLTPGQGYMAESTGVVESAASSDKRFLRGVPSLVRQSALQYLKFWEKALDVPAMKEWLENLPWPQWGWKIEKEDNPGQPTAPDFDEPEARSSPGILPDEDRPASPTCLAWANLVVILGAIGLAVPEGERKPHRILKRPRIEDGERRIAD